MKKETNRTAKARAIVATLATVAGAVSCGPKSPAVTPQPAGASGARGGLPQVAAAPAPPPAVQPPPPATVSTPPSPPPIVQGPPARPYTIATPQPLPPVPLLQGPLAIKVVYPPANSAVPAPDSTFIFGTIGNGNATLTINGARARVYPNGAFMGWVRTPSGASPAYQLVAANGADTARLTQPLRAPVSPTPLPLTGRLVVDTSELAARRALILRDDEATTIRVRAPANATVTLMASGQSTPLTRTGEIATFSTTVPAGLVRKGGALVVERGQANVRVTLPPLEAPDDDRPHMVRLVPAPAGGAQSDTDAVVYGRATASDTYKWFFLSGTQAPLTGRLGGYSRIRLDRQLEVWVADADVQEVPAGQAPPLRTTANARVRSTAESADLAIPISGLPAFFVEQFADRIELTLYHTRGNTDLVAMPSGDSLIRHVTWEQVASDRVRFTLRLGARSIGYLAQFERGTFLLRVRRAPHVDANQPLRGLTIALDPGHPPAGATGPTSLFEGEAVLAVAERAKQMLESRGATVVMTRTTPAPLDLAPRRVTSRRANAHAFVSIHLNAYPDGVNPFTATNGTGTYFYRAGAEPLARATQRSLVANLGLADEGVFFRSLAVTVQTWMPAILCEGAFVIIPEQEAALRTAEFQSRYAQGIVEGLESYFREIGR